MKNTVFNFISASKPLEQQQIIFLVLGIVFAAAVIALTIWCSVHFFKQKAGEKRAVKAVKERNERKNEENERQITPSPFVSPDSEEKK